MKKVFDTTMQKSESSMNSFVIGIFVTIIFIFLVVYVGIPAMDNSSQIIPGTPPADLVLPDSKNFDAQKTR